MPNSFPSLATALIAGRSGLIERFTNEELAGKLLDIGVKPGARLQLVRRSPFGGCWYVKVDRLCLALRKSELACIIIK
ncbi:MAG: ferrous iron transport protein A [Lewinella sp.]|nr:ferrous iron transport protein A [Lewinella sp.]